MIKVNRTKRLETKCLCISGSKFDGDGNFNNWWAEQDLANFNDRVQCIKDEYSGFFFEEAQMNLNGDLTAG